MVRSIVIVLALLVQMTYAKAQVNDSTGAVISFDEQMKDYGDIIYGDSISYTFTFTNTGTKDLVIKNVVTTCACTSRKYTEGPIAPGKSGELIVSFNSGKQDKMGRQNKKITVFSNAINNPEHVILVVTVLDKK